jgi:uncharacterized protein (TIGR00299 family) protein
VNTLYFDAYSGVAGDMLLASLVDLGAPAALLETLPARLGLAGEVAIRIGEARRGAVRARRVEVSVTGPAVPRRLADIVALLERADLPDAVRRGAREAFTRLAEVEARQHGVEVEAVHFHEVGAHDALVDIVGTLLLLDALAPDAVLVSPVNVGGGRVRTQHGELPVPAPATLELLRGFTVYGSPVDRELATPTGAVLLATVARPAAALPRGRPVRVGWGAGGHELPWPNALRAVWLETDAPRPEGVGVREARVLEANIDDMTPEIAAALLAALMEAGARDAWVTPVVMKKGRPAMTVSVLAAPETATRLAEVLFRESTTLGLRTYPVETWELARTIETVDTPYGPVRVKVGWWAGARRSWAPEFEDAAQAAKTAGVPVRAVMEAAWSAYRTRVEEGDEAHGPDEVV